jgi:hypothetical protein
MQFDHFMTEAQKILLAVIEDFLPQARNKRFIIRNCKIPHAFTMRYITPRIDYPAPRAWGIPGGLEKLELPQILPR